MTDSSPDPSSDPLRNVLSKLRQQNSLLVSEYASLKGQISLAIARLDSEGRRLSRAGVDSRPDKDAQRRLLDSARKQAEAYAKELAMIKRKVESRCTLEAVIELEDSVSELEHRLQEAEFENKLLRRQSRLLDREEKQTIDPLAELSYVEREVEMYLRRIRDLEERQEANIEALRKSEKRLQDAETASKSLESVKREITRSQLSSKAKADGEALRLQIQRLETEKQSREQRFHVRISELEQEVKRLHAFEDFVKRQNSLKDEESKLLQIKVSEIESLRDISERHKRREMHTARGGTGSNSTSPLKKRPSLRSLTPVL